MAVTLRLLIFSLIIGLLAYVIFAVRSRISFGTYFSPSTDISPVQDMRVPSVSSESTHLQGWHKRALFHPHPNPHSITPEDDVVKLAVTSSGMDRPFGLSLVVFKSTANISSADDFGEDNGHESHRYIVVDALGRVSVLPSTSPDINGFLSLGRRVVLEFPMSVPWKPQDDESCQPLFEVAIALDSEEEEGRRKGPREMKTISIIGYPGMDRIKVQNKGYDYLPDTVRDLFLLVLEAGQWDRERVDKVVIEKVEKGTGYCLDL